MHKKVAGIILAGGKSSRMGQNKAFLNYNGTFLIDHMIKTLQEVGLKNIYVSGNFDGYPCIPDSVKYKGPAQAIEGVLNTLNPSYDSALFVPVDMPMITSDILKTLIIPTDSGVNGIHFKNHPLPIFIKTLTHHTNASSVKELIKCHQIQSLPLPHKFSPFMKNLNTPEDFKKVIDS